MPVDIGHDPVLLKQLGRRVEKLPNVDNSGSTSLDAFADLGAIGAVPVAGSKFEHELDTDIMIPFHLQGTHEFDDGVGVFARKQLRRSPKVVEGIMRFWNVFPKMHIIGEDVISKTEYSEVMLLVYKVLRADFDIYEAAEQIGKDWAMDSKGQDSMDAVMFADAFFELVDLWTCDIEEKTYVEFLSLLYERITIRTVVFFDGSVIRVAVEDKTKSVAQLIAGGVPLAAVSAFNHVAKFVKPKIQTIGDLADADVQDVEKMRQAYIERNNLSTQRVGAELFEILELMTRVTAGDVNSLDSLQGLADADPEAIDCIRAVFIRAQGISTTQQTLRHNIVAELHKFGIQDAMLSDNNMTEKYLQLYDLFCVKTGAEIGETARLELERIRRELDKHGVEDLAPHEVETTYHEFYADVIDTTGTEVVEKAKAWMESTTEESVAPFIKTEQSTYSPIAEAKPFTAKDAKFQALVSPPVETKPGTPPPREPTPPKLAILEAPVVKPATPPKAVTSAPSPPPRHQPALAKPKPELAPEPDPVLPVAVSPDPVVVAEEFVLSMETPRAPTSSSEAPSPRQPFPEPAVVASSAPVVEGVDAGDVVDVVETPVVVDDEVPQVKEPLLVVHSETIVEVSEEPPVEEYKRTAIVREERQVDEAPTKLVKKKTSFAHDVASAAEAMARTVEPPRIANVLVTGSAAEPVAPIARYIHLLGLTDVVEETSEAAALVLLEPAAAKKIDLVVYVAGAITEAALSKITLFREHYQRPVIVVGGDEADPAATERMATECMARGALYFAPMPVDFKELRSRLQGFLDASPHKFLLKRKASMASIPKGTGIIRAAVSTLLNRAAGNHGKLQPITETSPKKRTWLKEDAPPTSVTHLPALPARPKPSESRESDKSLAALVPHKPVTLIGGAPTPRPTPSPRHTSVASPRRHSHKA
ncbi:hypothetical protein ACHHYP_07499 [Achlya hypogyna]|uniref:Uncharacterized protein n=1 Tax=Achlya hypogyna TaxID=1202772 RepID=A0A1V9ZM86_ACHHY|nr:hypothetical protein ACHHYP_07499 [Achlya hypogyna]